MRPELSDHIQFRISQRSPLVLMIRHVFVEGLDPGWGKDIVSAPERCNNCLRSRNQECSLKTINTFFAFQFAGSGVACRKRHQIRIQRQGGDLTRLQKSVVVVLRVTSENQRGSFGILRCSNAVHGCASYLYLGLAFSLNCHVQRRADKAPQASKAATFPSAKNLVSWVGACPGEDETAGVNRSKRSPKGNRQMRRILNQAANAAVKCKRSIFEIVYRRLLLRLGHNKTIGAIANRLCQLIWIILHNGVRYEERGPSVCEKAKRTRTSRMIRTLRMLGYRVEPAVIPA